MGGDGGVVATNRRYMRGAGSANHTADSKRGSASASSMVEAERESIMDTLKTCFLTGREFHFEKKYNKDDAESIVACPYGKLYGKEAAVRALLRRLEEEKNNNYGHDQNNNGNQLGYHVRGLKDLKPVRFQLATITAKDGTSKTVPICPITNIELNGLQPVFLIVKKKIKQKKKDKRKGIDNDNDNDENDDNQPNVLSEKAIKTMGIEALQDEYGPFEQDDIIRLAPPPGPILDEIKLKLEEKRRKEELSKKKKKRKMGKDSNDDYDQSVHANEKERAVDTSPKKTKMNDINIDQKKSNNTIPRTVDDVRSNVAATVASSAALSSLFENKKTNLSDKQKKDSLFACNC